MSEVISNHQIEREFDRNEVHSKITLCCLRTQNGKTFVAIAKIQKIIEEEDAEKLERSVHFIFTMNTIKANGQVAARLKSIERKFGEGSVYILNSNKHYLGSFTHVSSIQDIESLFTDRRKLSMRPRVIVVCGNKKRFEDAYSFMDCLNVNCTRNDNRVRAFVYVDEFHDRRVNTNENRKVIEQIHSMSVVREITLLSATPKRIFRNEGIWKYMRMIDLRTFDVNPMYRGIVDLILSAVEIENETQIIDLCPEFIPKNIILKCGWSLSKPRKFSKEERLVLGYVQHILNTHPTYLRAGNRLFIPAHIRKCTHYYLQKMLLEMSPTVAIILTNGTDKILQLPGPEPRIIQLEPKKKAKPVSWSNVVEEPDSDPDFDESNQDEELSETIARFYTKYELHKYTLVFTGFYLVSMGQTLIHETVGPFTHEIVSHTDLESEDIYQLIGRSTARMGKKINNEWVPWETLCDTIIHCPSTTYKKAKAMEECARNMANFADEFVTREDYLGPLHVIENGAYLDDDTVHVEKVYKQALPCIGEMIGFSSEEDLFEYYKTLEETHGGKFKDHKKDNSNDFIKGFQKEGVFLKCSLGKDSEVQEVKAVDAYAKKCTSLTPIRSVTAGLGANLKKLEKANDMIHRVYIGYTNKNDVSTIRYYLRWVKAV